MHFGNAIGHRHVHPCRASQLRSSCEGSDAHHLRPGVSMHQIWSRRSTLDRDAPMSRAIQTVGRNSVRANPGRVAPPICPDLVSDRDSGARTRMMFPLASARLRRGLTALTCPTSPEQLQPLRGSGNLLRDPNWLLASGFCRSRRWLGYHNRIGNCLRNIDRFRAGLMNTNHARPP